MAKRFVGILPAAGVAARLQPSRYPKELLPVVYVSDSNGMQARPLLAVEYSLDALRQAGVERCLVVISPAKGEILRYLGDGGDRGMRLAYLVQATPRGLTDAVLLGTEWCGEANVCLALPDSVFHPREAVAGLVQELESRDADLVLGVFPTQDPQNLGPVRVAPSGEILEVLEKPRHTDLRNTWGVAAWSPRFGRFLKEYAAGRNEGSSVALGTAFHAAIEAGLRTRALFFGNGAYVDVGRPESIASLVIHDRRPGSP